MGTTCELTIVGGSDALVGVAQSRVEQIPLVTADPLVRKYPIETIW